MTTKEEIRQWLINPITGENRKDITNMLVVCDTFDYEDYPVYVTNKQDVKKILREYNEKDMQRVVEVYSYNHNLEAQLSEERVFHFD